MLTIYSYIYNKWSKLDDFERLNVNNGLLLCANHDGMFDKGLIGIDSERKIIISSKVMRKSYQLLNLDKQTTINIRPSQIKYLEWHKNNILQ